MKLEVVELPLEDADDVCQLLNSLNKQDKLYSFDDFNSLITNENIIEVTAAVNDLKLSIFQIKNKADFTKEKIEVAYKRKKDQFQKDKLKHAIVNKVNQDNVKINSNTIDDLERDTENTMTESNLVQAKLPKIENECSNPEIPLEKQWESFDN